MALWLLHFGIPWPHDGLVFNFTVQTLIFNLPEDTASSISSYLRPIDGSQRLLLGRDLANFSVDEILCRRGQMLVRAHWDIHVVNSEFEEMPCETKFQVGVTEFNAIVQHVQANVLLLTLF